VLTLVKYSIPFHGIVNLRGLIGNRTNRHDKSQTFRRLVNPGDKMTTETV
jgi:hypothetical protein